MQLTIWWAMTVIVSTVAIIGYWLIARRQVRTATAQLRRELENERAIVRKVSHRLRDPLTVIYGFSEALLDADLRDEEEVRSVLTMVNSEALDVMRTVEDLVASQEFEEGTLGVREITFNPSAEIDRAATPFRRLGAEVSVKCPTTVGISDPIRFRQVTQNLLSNAVRHGGSQISVVAGIEDAKFRCTVADDGEGLPAAVRTQHFSAGGQPPVRPDEGPKGGGGESPPADEVHLPAKEPADTSQRKGDPRALGLGLAVAIAVAESLGGAIEYEQVPGLAMFTLVLPAENWQEADGQVTKAPAEPDHDEAAVAGEDDPDNESGEDDPGNESGIDLDAAIRFDDVDDGGEHAEAIESSHDDEGATTEQESPNRALEPSVDTGPTS